MIETVRYGIIGCGMMGQEHIRNIQLLPDTEVAAIYEPDAGMQAAAQALARTAVFTESIADLLTIDSLDALLIASPNHLHLEQMEQILAIRPLPLLVEKPLYTSSTDAARIDRLTTTYPETIWVAMEYRYMPPIAAFLEMRQLQLAASRC